MPAPLPPRTTAIRSALTGLLLATALGLTGCAGTGAAASPDSSADPGRSHSDTAHEDLAHSDMSHSDMSHSDMSHSDMSDSAGQPSAAAAMICSADIRDAIAAVLALPEPVAGQDSYTGAHYACTYPLAGGPLELAVHEGADPAAAQAYADSIRADYGTAENIEGLANLGFPAYRTAEGAVVFVKDSMVLVVDARGVTVPEGADSPSRTDAAYQIATNVLACWKEHHSG